MDCRTAASFGWSQRSRTGMPRDHSRRRRIGRRGLVALVGLLVLIFHPSARAQSSFVPSGPLSPQAKTADELDEYGFVAESVDPKETLKLANKFLKRYPDSEFRLYTIILETHAYEVLNDYQGVLAAGQDGLKIAPNNVELLTTLANAMADRPRADPVQREKSLGMAESYARRAQAQLDLLVRPFSVPRPQFGKEKQDAQADITAILGLIAFQRQDYATAISDYEQATALAPEPRGVDFYRLGCAYLQAGQYTKGIDALEQAASLGPPLITTLARQQIEDAQKAHR